MTEDKTNDNNEERRKYMANWREKNKEKYREYMREYNKKYKQENREYTLNYSKRYYQENKEKMKQQVKDKASRYCEYCDKEVSHFKRHTETKKHIKNVNATLTE